MGSGGRDIRESEERRSRGEEVGEGRGNRRGKLWERNLNDLINVLIGYETLFCRNKEFLKAAVDSGSWKCLQMSRAMTSRPSL